MRRAFAVALGFAALVACGNPVRVGAIVSRSGAAAGVGDHVARGFDLAVEQINRAGGVRGRPIVLVYRDDATNPEVGLAAARDLVERENVSVLLGAVSSPVTLRLSAYCERRQVVLLSPTASAPQITTAGEFVFRTYPSELLEGSSMAEFARGLGLDRVAVLAVDDDTGRALSRVFGERFTASGGANPEVFTFAEGDERALAAAIAGIVAAKPRGLYAPVYLPELAAALKALRGANLRPIVLGTSAVNEDLVRLAGPAAENVVVPMPHFDADSEETAARAFTAAYRERFSDTPDGFAAHAFDAVKLLAAAADRARSWSPDDLRRALLSIQFHDGATGRMAFDANGDLIQYPRLYVVRGGQFVAYDRFVEGGGTLPVAPR
jgi:branched-chain amino acid transport system substrate-binding protein